MSKPQVDKPKLTAAEQRQRREDRVACIRLRMAIGYELDERGITTPAAIGERVNALMQEVMRDPAITGRLTQQLLEPVTESIPATRAFISAEIVRARELLRSVNHQPE